MGGRGNGKGHRAWEQGAGRLAVEQGAGRLAVEQGAGRLAVEQGAGRLAADQGAGRLAADGQDEIGAIVGVVEQAQGEELPLNIIASQLQEQGLLPEWDEGLTLSDEHIRRRHTVFTKCQFGAKVCDDDRRQFLQGLLKSEANLAAKQTDIGYVSDPKYIYKLRLRNEAPIKAKPIRLRPHEEAWLDVHLDELLSKGVIGPILPHEQPRCVTPLLLVPGQQSGQAYRVVQNIVPVNKRTDEYQYQLNDTRRYRAKLARAHWISMIDLKAGFYNIPFEEQSSYDSTFVTHRGKFRWLKMTMGLTQAPAHFQFVVEDVLKGERGARQLPVVVYLDDIAVFGDDQQQVLDDTLEAIKRLTQAGFMINLSKSHLVEESAKILGHNWFSGGYWEPVTTKIEALNDATPKQLGQMNRASLYGLLNFYREYVPAFAELTEPIRQLLGQDARPWTEEATDAIKRVTNSIMTTPRWMNADPNEELRMESRVQRTGVGVLLLQRHPDQRRTWAPVASWGRCLEALEREESRVMLELKALREGCHKLADFTAFSPHLTIRISPALKMLLKISSRAHPQLQALMIDLSLYQPKYLVNEASVAPPELGFEDELPEPTDDLAEEMKMTDRALKRPIHLPPKARFVEGPAIHIQFDGGAQDGQGTGGFVILDPQGNEVIRAGRYYGSGRTNNEAEAFALRDAMRCLAQLSEDREDLRHPVRVFGDSQLMIRFLTRIYKKPQSHTIYWALQDVRRMEAKLGKPVTYRHTKREANLVPDDMARRALTARQEVIYWKGDIPEDAPPNQVREVYFQQEPQSQLDWTDLPTPMEFSPVTDLTSKDQPSVACIFGPLMSQMTSYLDQIDCRQAALQRLLELVPEDATSCLATIATDPEDRSIRTSEFGPELWHAECAIHNISGQPNDDRPCFQCNQEDRQQDMILCDRCNQCYHKDCAQKTHGTEIHNGPWFCERCKGELTLYGFDDVTQDWPLIDHLFSGYLPNDPDEADRIENLAQYYRANGEEMQVKLPATSADPERWVDVPPLINRPGLLMDTHDSLGHCGREKLIAAIRLNFWWPGLHSDAAECLRRCPVCQKEKTPKPTPEVTRWIDKGEIPFAGWSLDAAGPFPTDDEGNRYLFVAVDPFSKWVEAVPVPSLHSWRAADFLYHRIVTHWGKPRFIRTDNGSEFQGSLHRLCQALGIAHHRITTGNSKANGQVERVIRTLKETIRRGLTKEPASYWSNHLAPALAMLRFTPHRATGLSPFSLVTGRSPQLPSLPARPLPQLPEEPDTLEEEAYYEAFSQRVFELAKLGGRRIADMERRIRATTRKTENDQVHPTLLFHFEPGQLVNRRHRAFSKLDPRATGPFRVRAVQGVYRQKVTIEPVDPNSKQRKVTIHASQLVPYLEPYRDPVVIDLSPEPKTKTKTEPVKTTEDTQMNPPEPIRKSKRRKPLDVWDLAQRM